MLQRFLPVSFAQLCCHLSQSWNILIQRRITDKITNNIICQNRESQLELEYDSSKGDFACRRALSNPDAARRAAFDETSLTNNILADASSLAVTGSLPYAFKNCCAASFTSGVIKLTLKLRLTLLNASFSCISLMP